MVDEGAVLPDEEATEFLSDGWSSILLELQEPCEQWQRAAKLRTSGGPPDDRVE
jgi:hypothetical protein